MPLDGAIIDPVERPPPTPPTPPLVVALSNFSWQTIKQKQKPKQKQKAGAGRKKAAAEGEEKESADGAGAEVRRVASRRVAFWAYAKRATKINEKSYQS